MLCGVRQRAVSDAYGIIVNVVTSDQHNWCAMPLQLDIMWVR